MEHEITVDLLIVDFECHPEEITNAVGIVPTKTWLRGDKVTPRTGHLRKQNGWLLASGVDQHAEFDEHVKAILAKIEPHLDALSEVCMQYYVELSIALYLYEESEESLPAVHFSKHALTVLNALGAEIDFDLYVLPGD